MHGAHPARAGDNAQHHAQVFLQALFQAIQFRIGGDGFDAGQQVALLLARQAQHADVGLRLALPRVQQLVPAAHAGAGRALLAYRERQ